MLIDCVCDSIAFFKLLAVQYVNTYMIRNSQIQIYVIKLMNFNVINSRITEHLVLIYAFLVRVCVVRQLYLAMAVILIVELEPLAILS